MTAVFAGQHPCFGLIGRTSLLKIKVNFSAIAFWAHVGFGCEHAFSLIRIFDDFVLALLSLGGGLGFGEVDFLSTKFHFYISRSRITTFVVGAGDVATWTRERKSSTLGANHVRAIDIIHLMVVVTLGELIDSFRRINLGSSGAWQHSIPSGEWTMYVAVVFLAISSHCQRKWRRS